MLLEKRDTTLGEQKNESSLKSFSIYGLFGYKNITIPFNKKALVIISENGAGKTTLLNIIYYSLIGEFDKLKNFDFQRIVFEFRSGKTSEITKSEITKSEIKKNYEENIFYRRYHFVLDFLKKESKNIEDPMLIENQKQRISEINKLLEGQLNKSMATEVDDPVMYFPTYRRIEEELKNLGNDSLKNQDFGFSLIQFGMEDVQDTFNQIKSQITDFALELYSKLTGDVLTQIIENYTVTQDMRDKIKPDILGIILSRVGEQNISRDKQDTIENLIQTGEIHESNKYDQLVYFLSKLIELYELQKSQDELIKKFVFTCNKYFEYFSYSDRKRLVYDETNADIYMLQMKSNEKIDLKDLSSGEKQILSLFTKVYLELKDDFIFIIDEPELSLSLE